MTTLVKTLVDIGPLIIFLIVDGYAGIFVATGFLMIACLIAFYISWSLTHKIALLPVLTLVFVLIFGGLTLLLKDDSFIKIEVTITNALLGIFLLGGMIFRQPLLKLLFGEIAHLDDEGWHKMSWRMGWFFVGIALLNEVVWRSVETDTWVSFRVYGILGLTLIFLLSQIPVTLRHMVKDNSEKPD